MFVKTALLNFSKVMKILYVSIVIILVKHVLKNLKLIVSHAQILDHIMMESAIVMMVILMMEIKNVNKKKEKMMVVMMI